MVKPAKTKRVPVPSSILVPEIIKGDSLWDLPIT